MNDIVSTLFLAHSVNYKVLDELHLCISSIFIIIWLVQIVQIFDRFIIQTILALLIFISDLIYTHQLFLTLQVDVISQDLIIIPIHFGVHWATTVAVDFVRKEIIYYDSKQNGCTTVQHHAYITKGKARTTL